LIKKWDDTHLWYKKDDEFERPKAIVSMKIYTNDCYFGDLPNSRVFVKLWSQILQEYLREFNYQAICANLSFEITPMYDNINFKWSGFNDTMPIFIEQTISRMQKMKGDNLEEIFDQIKEKLLVDW